MTTLSARTLSILTTASILTAAAISLATMAVAAQAAPTRYGDTLLADSLRQHPEIVALGIEATVKSGQVVTLSQGKSEALAKATPMPLANSVGEPIGSAKIVLRRHQHSDKTAAAILADLSRHIYVADNLIEPDPFVAGARRGPFAQSLVDRMLESHPNIITLAMHVSLPGQQNTIIASNFGRIGKAADEDDMHVMNDKATRKEVTNGGRRLAVELPMLDSGGTVIGALSTSFGVDAAHSADAAYAESIAVRDELARLTPSIAALDAARP